MENKYKFKRIELYRDGNQAYFTHYRKGFLYYKVLHPATDQWYGFAIPIEDLGDATVNLQEKALMLGRYINPAYDSNELFLITE